MNVWVFMSRKDTDTKDDVKLELKDAKDDTYIREQSDRIWEDFKDAATGEHSSADGKTIYWGVLMPLEMAEQFYDEADNGGTKVKITKLPAVDSGQVDEKGDPIMIPQPDLVEQVPFAPWKKIAVDTARPLTVDVLDPETGDVIGIAPNTAPYKYATLEVLDENGNSFNPKQYEDKYLNGPGKIS